MSAASSLQLLDACRRAGHPHCPARWRHDPGTGNCCCGERTDTLPGDDGQTHGGVG